MRPPGGETVASQGVRVKRHLLQGWEEGEEVSREEAELVTVEEESPEGRQVTEDERRQGNKTERTRVKEEEQKEEDAKKT